MVYNGRRCDWEGALGKLLLNTEALEPRHTTLIGEFFVYL